MAIDRFVGTSTLALALGIAALTTAQTRLYAQDQRDEAKPQQQEDARPAAKQDEAKTARDNESRPAQDEPKATREGQSKAPEQTEDRPAARTDNSAARQEDRNAPQPDRNGQPAERNGQTAQQPPARGGEQRAGGNRIPDDKFRASFGREHRFVMQRPTIVDGRPRFQYGGYSFILVDAWPAGWAYTDPCYIDYIDGEYFLFDLAHPGVRIAIEIV